MRILPSQSSVMKRKVGSTVIHHGEIQPIAFGDRPPVVHSRAAQGIDTEADPGAADGLHIDDVSQIVNIGRDVVVLVRGGSRQSFGKRTA